MGTGRRCAYCDTTGDLTNEHVVPDFYHRTFGETISIIETQTEEKAVSNPQGIKDVCANCNNIALSQLDGYLAALTTNYFSTIVQPGDRVRFEYDFDLLLRVLLKVAYNLARTRNWSTTVFQQARKFIVVNQPNTQGFRIFLQLLIPTPVRKTDLPVTPGTTEIPPLLFRADLYDVSGLPGLAFACSLSFRSYRFFILLENMKVSANIRRQSIATWLKQNNGATELTNKGSATVYASSLTVLDAVKGSPSFKTQLAKARQLKTSMKGKKSKKP